MVVIAFLHFIICAVILDSKLQQLMGMWSKLQSSAKSPEQLKGSLGLNYEIDKCVLFPPYDPLDLVTLKQPSTHAHISALWLSQDPQLCAPSGFRAFIHRRECAFFLSHLGLCQVICLKRLLKLPIKVVL